MYKTHAGQTEPASKRLKADFAAHLCHGKCRAEIGYGEWDKGLGRNMGKQEKHYQVSTINYQPSSGN